MKKLADWGKTVVFNAEKIVKPLSKKREVPVLSESKKKLFTTIETSSVFGEEAFFARYSNIKKNG